MNLIDDIALPGSLWAIMFSMGLSLTWQDFGRVFTERRALLVGVGAMLVVPPLVGIIIATKYAPTPELAVGFVLLATCPGGMLSNLMTDLSKGDLALSMSVTIVVSFVYIFAVPFYAHFALLHFMGERREIDVPMLEFIGSIFSMTLVPVTLGVLLRRFRPGLAINLRGYIKIIAMVVLVGAFITILIDQVEVLRQNAALLLQMTLACNLIVLAAASLVSRFARLTAPQTAAVCIEHLIRQEGTAIYIAVAIVGSREMSLPMIMNTPIGLVLCIIFVLVTRSVMARYRQAQASLPQPQRDT
jgi:BASS family bile acid:Na+ symporter